MLTSNVVILRPLLNFLVLFMLPPPTEAGCSWLELLLVVREQFFRRLVGYVLNMAFLPMTSQFFAKHNVAFAAYKTVKVYIVFTFIHRELPIAIKIATN